MGRRLHAWTLAIVAPLSLWTSAIAEELVSSLSADSIEITSNFAGEHIVVFAAVRETTLSADDYEVAILVRGPEEELVVRRKDRIAGLWINAASHEFFKVPAYYVVNLSENFSLAASDKLLAQYKLGLENLNFVRSAYDSDAHAFAEAVIDIREEEGLFVENRDAISFLAPDVFRTTFDLPTLIPTGIYRVSVFLFRNEKLIAARTENLVVTKTGISATIARFAREQGLIYGVLTVLLGIFTGWMAGLIFRRE